MNLYVAIGEECPQRVRARLSPAKGLSAARIRKSSVQEGWLHSFKAMALVARHLATARLISTDMALHLRKQIEITVQDATAWLARGVRHVKNQDNGIEAN